MSENEKYKPFEGLNLNGGREEGEEWEQYLNRRKMNKKIIKLYNTVGITSFKEMFPNGVYEALEGNYENGKEKKK
jgi:hypothetical protein